MSIKGKIKSLKERLKATLRDFHKGIRYREYNKEFPEKLDKQITYDKNLLERGMDMSLDERAQTLFNFTVRIYRNAYCPGPYFDHDKLTTKNRWLYLRRRMEIDAVLNEIPEHHR